MIKINWLGKLGKLAITAVMATITLAIVLAVFADCGCIRIDIDCERLSNMGAVSFGLSIVALSNTVLGFLNSEKGRYGFNQHELLSLSISRQVMIFLRIESIFCALLAFFAYICFWKYIECVCIIGCVVSVFLLVLLWIGTASERYIIQCIYSIVCEDCLEDYLYMNKKKAYILLSNTYQQKNVQNIFGQRLYRLMNQARLTDRYTLDLIMEGSFRAFGKNADIICATDGDKEYYCRKLYSMVFVFMENLQENTRGNLIYREQLYALIQDKDVWQLQGGIRGAYRFGFVSAVLHEICKCEEEGKQLSVTGENIRQDFVELLSWLLDECVKRRYNHIIGDIYAFLEVYFRGCKIPKDILGILEKYKVDYPMVAESIKDSKQFYIYGFSELNKLNVVNKFDVSPVIEMLTDDMDAFLHFDYFCKSKIMREIQGGKK